MNLKEDPRWIEARQKEMESLKKFGVFEEVEIGQEPKDALVSKCRWLYVLKNYPYENFLKGDEEAILGAKFKARCIVQGFGDPVEKLDTYSPTPNIMSVRILITLAIRENWEIGIGDVSTAFLHADTQRKMYVIPPEHVYEENEKPIYWLLKKSLYGLKDAPRNWHIHIRDLLTKIGFKKIETEESMYTKFGSKGKCQAILLVYVDDILLASTKNEIDKYFKIFKKSLTIGDPEFLNDKDEISFLGFGYKKYNNYVEVNSKKYIDKMMEAYKKLNLGLPKSSIVPGVPLSLEELQNFDKGKYPLVGEIKHKIYRRIVGQSLWLANIRADIKYSAMNLSKKVHSPNTYDFSEALRLLKYLELSSEAKIYIKPTNVPKDLQLTGFSDADLGNSHTRKSTTGGIITLFGAIIATKSKTQQTISLSSGESEFNALVANTADLLHAKEVLSEMGYHFDKPMMLTDSSVAIQIIFQNSNGRAKNIDRKMSWLKGEVKEKKSILVKHIDGKENIADLLTKYVSSAVMTKLREYLLNTSKIDFKALNIKQTNKREDKN